MYYPTTFYFDSLNADADLSAGEISADSLAVAPAEETTAYAFCDRSVYSPSLPWTISQRFSGETYSGYSSGTWNLDLWASGLYYLAGQGVYNWPAGPYEGFWDARNVFTLAQAYVFISQGRGACYLRPVRPGVYQKGIRFFQFYGVQVKDQQIRSSSSGGGGGTGGSCSFEFVIVEIDYGDGTGWHELWRGYAKVCG